MFVGPVNMTLGQMTLMCQAAELQAMGHMPGVRVDLAAMHQNVLERSFEALNPPQWLTPTSTPSFERSTQIAIEALTQSMQGSMGFQPHVDPHFGPRQVIMRRASDEIPIVIEKRNFEEARPHLNRKGKAELDRFEDLANHESMEPVVFTLRSWDGAVHALSIGMLTVYNNGVTMICSRDLKFNRRVRSSLQEAGVVLTLARLLYMHGRGFWSDDAPVLMDIKPPVLESYRMRLNRLPAYVPVEEWSVSRREAEAMLVAPPYVLAPLTDF